MTDETPKRATRLKNVLMDSRVFVEAPRYVIGYIKDPRQKAEAQRAKT